LVELEKFIKRDVTSAAVVICQPPFLLEVDQTLFSFGGGVKT